MIKIGIDIDNVISDSYPAYLDKFNVKFGTKIELAEIREFYYFNRLIEKSSVKDGKMMAEYVDTLVFNEEFQLSFVPIADSLEVIKYWAKKGYQIHYITLRPQRSAEPTKKWLQKHGYWVKGAKLDLLDDKKGYKSDLSYKREVADKNKINVFIEDALDIASELDIPVILLDQPWNQGKLKKNIIRVYSWMEIEGILPKVIGDL